MACGAHHSAGREPAASGSGSRAGRNSLRAADLAARSACARGTAATFDSSSIPAGSRAAEAPEVIVSACRATQTCADKDPMPRL